MNSSRLCKSALNYLYYIIFDSLPLLISFISLINLESPICKLMLQDPLSDKCSSAVEGHWSGLHSM